MSAHSKLLEIDRLRQRIANLREEIRVLREGRQTREEAAETICDWVDSQARQVNASPAVMALIAGQRPTTTGLSTIALGSGDGGIAGSVDLAPFLAWLDPEAMKDRLLEELDAVAPTFCSETPRQDREAKLKKKAAELDKLESEEEAAIAAAEAEGVEVTRRPDVRPEIVLEATNA